MAAAPVKPMKAKARVNKTHAKTLKILGKAGLHVGIRQHYIGKGPKNTELRNKGAQHLKQMRKLGNA